MKRQLAYAVLVALAFAGCRGGENAANVELTVFAAASLTDAFRDLAAGFEKAHPGVKVTLNLAGSQILRMQIENGAPADVYASADARHMDALDRAGLVRDRFEFAHNELVVIVPRDAPAGWQAVGDVVAAERLVVGDPETPVGAYTRAFLDRAGERFGASFRAWETEHTVSREPNVRLVLAKVGLGEADAGVVYRTDAVTTDRVRTIRIPADLNVTAAYHAALVSETPRAELARAWLAYLRSPEGRATLVRHGFRAGD